ncbi:hypothetical protein [Chitinophaga sp.]|uniref:hypothetical protein n=1 Tax=Chitinophaga sp. TaxID=1869181 RepID=UPI0031D8F680
MHRGINDNDRYPDFVLLLEEDHCNGRRILDICGQLYTANGYDHFIDTAIELARQWQRHQVTYERVVHLRNWLRENETYQVPLIGVKSVLGCKEFVDRVIAADYVESGARNREFFIKDLRENERLFFEEEAFADTD